MPGNVGSDVEADLRRLRSRLETEIERTRAELGEDIRSVRGRVEQFADGYASVAELRGEVHGQISGLESELAGLARMVTLIGQQVQWLQRQIMATGAAETYDPDEASAASRTLAARVEEAELLRDRLLPDDRRRQLEGVVGEFATWRRRWRQQADEALAASAILAETRPGESRHSQGRRLFSAARGQLDRLTRLHDPLAERARQAADRLQADDAERDRSGAQIEAGESAWRTLETRLRTALAEAVDRGAMFPTWFTATLGLAPPADALQSWLDTATDLVAYRITYRVTSPVSPLGDRPPADASLRRHRWYGRLHTDLARLR